MATASERWSHLVRARAEAASRVAQSDSRRNSIWDRWASRMSRHLRGGVADDPLIHRLRKWLDPETTLLDVGCGWGRFALEVAPCVARVIAVDPSSAMLEILRRESRERKITNIHDVEARWEKARVDKADVTICAHVLSFIEDAAAFLDRLDRSSKQQVFVYMNALGSETPDPFWRRFHGSPLPPSPTYLDALDVLKELGIDPDIEIVELRRTVRYPSLEEAVEGYRESLALEDTRSVDAELLALLERWLVKEGGGWRPPFAALPAAILSWTPRR